MGLGSTLAIQADARAARVALPRAVKEANPRFTRMTPRLTEVRDLIGQGLRDAEIAARLGISLGATKVYCSQVYKLTGKRRVDIQREGFRVLPSDGDGLPRMGAFE